MALTRKMLSAMDIPSEKIDEIINAHTETVTGLKEEIDRLKSDIDKLSGVEEELKTTKEDLASVKSNDWEQKYKDTKAAYDTYKADIEAKEKKSIKNSAYRKVLVKAGVSEKRIDSIIKISAKQIDSLELDDDGNASNEEDLINSIKSEWSDFIPTVQEKGADVAKPPANDGDIDIHRPSRAAELTAKYHDEHYGKSN